MTTPVTDERAAGGLVEVRLLRFPLALWRLSSEHHEELMREFALLALSTPAADGDRDDRSGVPARLLDLIDTLGRKYAGVTEAPNTVRDAAADRGEPTVDLTYQVPRDAREASLQLDALLDEAEQYCRAGEQLLTLAAPPDVLAFRRWYLSEFVAQLDGRPPTPWPGPLA